MSNFWDEKRTEALENGRRAGMSATQIGMEIGASRSAVLGKAHRLKLDGAPREPAGRKCRSLWKADDIGRLHQLAHDGLTASQIASKMDRNVSGVMAVATRQRIAIVRFTKAEQDARAAAQREKDKAKKKRKRHRLVAPKIVCKPGTSKTSAVYRAKLGRQPEMTKSEMYRFLAQACVNTAALSHG